ncbi:hypothetical protein DMW99_29430 [Pseudomonas chlororaphis]|nr:hypothetical protein C1Y36_17200 [Pseudomonas sp. FW306-2-2C-D06C]PYC30205.1 hypothetical protein DMW99_29430 [Pseudomonas chlororaphis]
MHDFQFRSRGLAWGGLVSRRRAHTDHLQHLGRAGVRQQLQQRMTRGWVELEGERGGEGDPG